MSKQDKIICLGKEFNSEEERREYFRNELRAKLPELKEIEGFPIGEDEDIINLSDPPYYTACPNPWLNDFIDEWEKEKESMPGRNKEVHVDEPYASDVSEGKNNPIYNAHSYHTKVPHPAIMRYILHYTQPGDIILDGFAGTGMTGVASQLCEYPSLETKYKIEKEFRENGLKTPKWGTRYSVCGDLSPIASFIAYNYNTPIDLFNFENEAKRILLEIEKECGWMYETQDKYGKGRINYTVWSNVFICPSCSGEIVFYDVAVDKTNGLVRDEFICPHCNSLQTKRTVSKAKVTSYDTALQQTIVQTKSIPVLINYTRQGKRYDKSPDINDLALIKKIEDFVIPYWFPTNKIPKGDKTGEPLREGITNVHHFYTKRALYIFSAFNSKAHGKLLWLLTATTEGSSKLNRERPFGLPSKLSGTLYVSSMIREIDVLSFLKRKIETYKKALIITNSTRSLISVNSATSLINKSSSFDYIFSDPPFGSNLMYSELNFLWESWLKVTTNNELEAIENKTQRKTLLDYQSIMTRCFQEYFRVLKPNKWMTVEFSNTSAAVWNGIQTAIQRAGFIIANVAALDKKQGSFNAVTNPTSVKQDLVISCYKPSEDFESKFKTLESGLAVWDFVTEHIHHLPAHIGKENSTTAIVERSPKILFDRLITFYLMRGLPVPMDAKDFQEGLRQRFVERDGMYFTAEQAAEYDEKKAKAPQFVQLSLIVINESDAIEWLKDRLRKQAQKYQDITNDFKIATQALRKGDQLPELIKILEQNFIEESDGRWRTPDPNEAKDREALRTKVLLKEFNGYVTAISQPRAKKLKEVRVEALRAGFKNCWEQKDFKTIVTIGDMIPQNILLEDERLLMYYDIAKDRV